MSKIRTLAIEEILKRLHWKYPTRQVDLAADIYPDYPFEKARNIIANSICYLKRQGWSIEIGKKRGEREYFLSQGDFDLVFWAFNGYWGADGHYHEPHRNRLQTPLTPKAVAKWYLERQDPYMGPVKSLRHWRYRDGRSYWVHPSKDHEIEITQKGVKPPVFNDKEFGCTTVG